MEAVAPFCICFILNEHSHELLYSSHHHQDLNTVHVTSYLRNLADLPRRFSADLRAAKCGCP